LQSYTKKTIIILIYFNLMWPNRKVFTSLKLATLFAGQR
jgi:hypothetical protein